MEQALSSKYQQKSDKEHVLENPDTYVGSVEQITSLVWTIEPNEEEPGKIKIKELPCTYVPALLKLLDEGIVNCRDHVVRMKAAITNEIPNIIPVTYIHVSISKDGTITMTNDGNGIDVAMHPEYNIWIPELIFGHLRTSTNYDKEEKKIVGGKNGFGFKLVLIWSTEGSIETVDHVRQLKYTQEFKNNLDVIEPPKITKFTKRPYTKITFKPDYARLGIPEGLTGEVIALLQKRIYDIAAVTDTSIKVKFNDQLVPVKNFSQYIDLYIGNKDASKRVYQLDESGRWEYAVALTPSHEFVHVSFVNGIHTSKGGKHVEYILNQITRGICALILKKKKIVVNANTIKEQIILFLRCDIENPSFDSQTKDYMTTPYAKFGSSCNVDDKFIEKVAKLGVLDVACSLTEVKEIKSAKKSDGAKTRTVRGIPKLVDANWAGTEKSSKCIIIFCEGDSAKSGILSGLVAEDRNIFGVYPLKGKLLNVRGENVKKIADNKEITEIKKIMGLEIGRNYSAEDVQKRLRYSKILIMCDQDHDGSHIKGLCINLFHSEWPSLLQIPNFIGFMNTPIIKATTGPSKLSFYCEGEYRAWKEANEATLSKWHIKYYKGLGTSTGKEFREYFVDRKLVSFAYNEEESGDRIDMIFNSKRADDRKSWLGQYERDSFIDTKKDTVSYEEFINHELIHFSKYDCDRSIPNLMDGLKISLRKILFAAFKKNLINEIKVAQFSGYVSENSMYHHGEASLNGAIVGMAQNFVGSNNINLLLPNGQFGTRMQGGKDSASERYIYTALNPITRFIFCKQDDDILYYLNDDGVLVEPNFYVPIIPMILVNGSKGIGTGFSTDIMCYNPLTIIQYIEWLLQKVKVDESSCEGPTPTTSSIVFEPYYEGFKGKIEKLSDTKYLFKGIYNRIHPDKIEVTELPVGFWTDDFKELLETLVDTNHIKDYTDSSTDTTIHFTITFPSAKLDELLGEHNEVNGCNGLEKLLKLFTTKTNTNMHLFDAFDKLKKYATVESIIEDYYGTRLQCYDLRKKHLLLILEKKLHILSNKVKYISELLAGTIDLRKMKKDDIHTMMVEKGYGSSREEYGYLIKLPMDSVSEENVASLQAEFLETQIERDRIASISLENMWHEDLQGLKEQYTLYKSQRSPTLSGVIVNAPKKKRKEVEAAESKKKPKK
jgi:DNA topoisomerase-2